VNRYRILALLTVLACLPAAGPAGAWPFRSVQALAPACLEAYPPPASGYGAPGAYDYDVREIPNPHWRRKPVSVFLPRSGGEKLPVIFFSHAYAAFKWEQYFPDLMRHLASRGNIVVFVPYRAVGVSHEERYATLWDGFQTAVDSFADSMDLTRVAFVGHSFGGGATPYMAYRGLVDSGWGAAGAYIFIMAPWYSFQVDDDMLAAYPQNTKLVVQIYDRDTTNDHRMAIDLYNAIGLPAANKAFLEVRSGAHAGCTLDADHTTPARNPLLSLKAHAVFAPLDAMGDYVFRGIDAGREFVFGDQPEGEIGMGRWADGEPYPPMLRKVAPQPEVPQAAFRFPWDNKRENPRQ